MDIKAMVGKTFTINLVSNNTFGDITGKVSESEYGEDVLHIIDSEESEYDIPFSAIASFFEADEEEEEEEPTEEEEPAAEDEEITPAKKAKYDNRSVDDIPARKKKGWLGF